MKYSSENQLTLDLGIPTKRDAAPFLSDMRFGDRGFSTVPSGPHSPETVGPVYAATSRAAGRINASIVPEAERRSLLRERQKLLDKKLDGTITRREMNRLEYVRWSLDRIEDAKYGMTLEALESSVTQYEQFRDELHFLLKEIKNEMPRRKR